MPDEGLVTQLLNLLAPSLRDVARQHGVSHDTVRAWKLGRRTPSQANLVKLVETAEKRSAALSDAARQIQEVGKE